ncbi:unnamed protein product, partial [Symbiodinium sp. KB8]
MAEQAAGQGSKKLTCHKKATNVMMMLTFIFHIVSSITPMTFTKQGFVSSNHLFPMMVSVVGMVCLGVVFLALHYPATDTGPYFTISMALAFHSVISLLLVGSVFASIPAVQIDGFCFTSGYTCGE